VTPPRPIGEPFSLVAGDTLQFDRDFPNFPASDGWALSYTLGGQGLTNITDISGANITSTGSTFNINVPAATTGKWSAGEYSWVAVVTGSGAFAGQRFTVATGQVEVKQNPASETALSDTRKRARSGREFTGRNALRPANSFLVPRLELTSGWCADAARASQSHSNPP
jgi:hypothetical protein